MWDAWIPLKLVKNPGCETRRHDFAPGARLSPVAPQRADAQGRTAGFSCRLRSIPGPLTAALCSATPRASPQASPRLLPGASPILPSSSGARAGSSVHAGAAPDAHHLPTSATSPHHDFLLPRPTARGHPAHSRLLRKLASCQEPRTPASPALGFLSATPTEHPPPNWAPGLHPEALPLTPPPTILGEP